MPEKVENVLVADDFGEVYLVTTTPLGHVADVDPDLIPEDCWDEYVRLLDEDRDGQKAARAYEAEAKTYR